MAIFKLSDKRQMYRIYNTMPVNCEMLDAQGLATEKTTIMAKDISSEGIYLEMNKTPPLNSMIKLAFRLAKDTQLINAVAQVARVESLEDKDLFGIGANFETIEENDRNEIKKFVDHLNINTLLALTISKGASDLHLLADRPPALRIHGEIEAIDIPAFSHDEITKLLYSIMTHLQIRKFEQEKELDFGLQYDLANRFRINLHQQKGFMEATLRLINTKIPSFKELNLPEVIKDLARLKDGLLLIVGPAGSGKTTTIAAMVELINQERKAVVITLERPIEYVHTGQKSIIKQREIGIDASSFSIALKSTFRQDSNVIVIGELDDIETVKNAIAAAEGGNLVVASFHSLNTLQGIDRLIGFFPPENRKQMLSQLANCTKGIVSQVLLPRKDKLGRVLACEVIIVTDAVKRIIRGDELVQLPTIIQTGSSYKMQSLFESINKCVEEGIVDAEIAKSYLEEFTKYGHK